MSKVGTCIWAIEWVDNGSADVAFESLSDAFDYVVNEAIGNSDEEAILKELKENFSEDGFWAEDWVWCYPMTLYEKGE